MSMLEDMGTYLAGKSVGVLGETLFLDYMPDQVDNCTVIYEYSGTVQVGFGKTKPAVEVPRIQVVVRDISTAYQTAKEKARNIYTYLSEVVDYTISNVTYLSVIPVQTPFLLERDDMKRVKFACNYTVWF